MLLRILAFYLRLKSRRLIGRKEVNIFQSPPLYASSYVTGHVEVI